MTEFMYNQTLIRPEVSLREFSRCFTRNCKYQHAEVAEVQRILPYGMSLQPIQYSNFVLLFRESPKSVYFTLEIILY